MRRLTAAWACGISLCSEQTKTEHGFLLDVPVWRTKLPEPIRPPGMPVTASPVSNPDPPDMPVQGGQTKLFSLAAV